MNFSCREQAINLQQNRFGFNKGYKEAARTNICGRSV